jgi:hypothetical protein
MAGVAATMWAEQDRNDGGRQRLFDAVNAFRPAGSVLYPGSYVDIAPSLVFPRVTYIDLDDRARRFFADGVGLAEIVGDDRAAGIDFVHGDYTEWLDLHDESFDLLVSLYAGFVSEACTQYLRVGGTLLVNPSHGDAAMASIDPRYRLVAAVHLRDGTYRVRTEDLGSYLVPREPVDVTPQLLHERRRGISYTRAPFAYLFERVT